MPRIVGPDSSKRTLYLVVAVLLFGFTPLSKVLLGAVGGSFSPTQYSSLALRTPANAAVGYQVGTTVPVQLTNRTGTSKTYHWSATQNGLLISLGEETVASGRSTKISVPSRGAVKGTLRIEITGTNIFVTVPLHKS